MFRSFFMAGFECATGFNIHNEPIDQIVATEHDRQLDLDYGLVGGLGINVIREGARWPLVDLSSGMDLSTLDHVLDTADEHGLQLILDLFHYGYPGDVDIFSPNFVDRFGEYCAAVALRVNRRTDGRHLFTTVNEPSYFAWAGADSARFRPHAQGRSFELKVQLARAAIRGMNEIMAIIPDARFVNVDPLCRVATPRDRPELEEEVAFYNDHVVFQSWDMLAGRLMPELGGSPRHLDIVGINYYWTNQWEHQNPGQPLAEDDDRCLSLGDLVRSVWRRYGAEMIISETAHAGPARASWIRQSFLEAESVLNDGIPLKGICLYPVLGMPEWHDQNSWARMGLWDLTPSENGLQRIPDIDSLEALHEAQSKLEGLDLGPLVQRSYLA